MVSRAGLVFFTSHLHSVNGKFPATCSHSILQCSPTPPLDNRHATRNIYRDNSCGMQKHDTPKEWVGGPTVGNGMFIWIHAHVQDVDRCDAFMFTNSNFMQHTSVRYEGGAAQRIESLHE